MSMSYTVYHKLDNIDEVLYLNNLHDLFNLLTQSQDWKSKIPSNDVLHNTIKFAWHRSMFYGLQVVKNNAT